ncbi:MAG: hypothetical protein ACRDRN_26585 [Sciscionella sp.]
MKVRMKVEMSGARNGVLWPKRGGVIDLPDAEAADMCRAKLAEPVAEKEPVEKAVPPKAEARALTTESASAVVKNK